MADEPDKPKRKRGGSKPKPVAAAMLQEGVEPKKNGGARAGAGAKRQFKRIDVAETLASLNFNPFVELVKLYSAPDTTTKDKINIAQDLGQYCAPKLRATEMKVETTEDSVLGNLMKALADNGRPKPPSEDK